MQCHNCLLLYLDWFAYLQAHWEVILLNDFELEKVEIGCVICNVDLENFSGCEYFLTNFASDCSFDAVLEIGVKSSAAVAAAMSSSNVL